MFDTEPDDKPKPKLSEVAKLAGVSIATVSNVINNKGRTSQETVNRIHQILRSLESQNASSSLVKRGAIAFASVDPMVNVNLSSLHMQLIQGMQPVLEKHGYTLVFANCSTPDEFRHRVSDAVGVVAVGFPDNPEHWTEAVDIPVIWALRSTSRNSDVVQEDNREIARLASEYFLGNGHRHVGFLSDSHVESVCERGWFLDKFMNDAGGKAVIKTGENIFYQKLDRKQTRRLLEDIMSSKPKPTALFVPGDRLCVAVYSILQDMGIRPQEDLTVLSCNNDGPFLYTMFPRPATIGMNVDVIGRRSAEMVLWRLANPDDQPVRILIRPDLILPD